jgi:hypothetical protein
METLMDDLYEILLGRPPAEPGRDAAPREPAYWDEADGEGPDRLFNRYRRLRLSALEAAGT